MATSEDAKNQATLVQALRNPSAHGHGVDRVVVLETHISYVLLTGRYAYKIKKAVDLGFLDYRTLAARRFYCDEEVRLNRRLAPTIYIDVVPITGTVQSPAVGGRGPVVEYAVRMREFSQDALLSRMLAGGTLTPTHIDALALKVAEFHSSIEVDTADGPFGRPEEVRRLALDNCAQLAVLVKDASDQAAIRALRDWTEREYAARASLIESRRRHGFVRECHGDLHLNNIALVDGEVAVFDCIEFNDHMRWSDVMSEVAFVAMDLEDRGRPDLAFRFLNAYLERTGDYAGLNLLRFFLAYRAMVRAKVAWLRLAQLSAGQEQSAALEEYRGYVHLAEGYARPARPALVLMHGLAGSGKTTQSQRLLESIGAVRIRTDVERKRLHGLGAQARSQSAIDAGLYAPAETEQTYRHVSTLARHVTAAGYVAVVDAASLKRWQRAVFKDLAAELAMPFLIVSVSASPETLRDRLAARSKRGADASEAGLSVLEYQERTQEPLAPDELPAAVELTAETMADSASREAFWREIHRHLGIDLS